MDLIRKMKLGLQLFLKAQCNSGAFLLVFISFLKAAYQWFHSSEGRWVTSLGLEIKEEKNLESDATKDLSTYVASTDVRKRHDNHESAQPSIISGFQHPLTEGSALKKRNCSKYSSERQRRLQKCKGLTAVEVENWCLCLESLLLKKDLDLLTGTVVPIKESLQLTK